jgi:lysine 2,3-aminomutase
LIREKADSRPEAEWKWNPMPGTDPVRQREWRWQLDHLLETPADLARAFGLDLPTYASEGSASLARPMRVTPYFAGLIAPGDPEDPILRQVLPGPGIPPAAAGEEDPLAERDHSPVPGLVHRYPDRALLLPSGFCAVLCRFCLRKRLWSPPEGEPERFDAERALAYISSRKEIREVILSGGDPLLLPAARLERLLAGLRGIDHVRILRIGTRLPAVLPMRIDEELSDLLASFRPIWIMTHFNHPREITSQAEGALSRLAAAGALLNNQSVLLRGVNDDTDVLLALSRRLMEAGVRPYYLHHLDRVAGVERFRVSLEAGAAIVKGMFGRIGGLGIPRYVLDLPGGRGKVPLTPTFLVRRDGRGSLFEGPLGGAVRVEEDGR